jgi:hypothetical protein|tara:strand:- start:1310 stop:1510 length:201 start_codon:yes stop_codon:yes gene_type:complete
MGLFNYLYNSYYFDEEEIEGAKKQIEFLERRILDMVAKNITEEQKADKIVKIRQTITALKYYYSLD